MLSQGQVGPSFSADGIQNPLRTGKTGEQVVGQLHPRYYEATYRQGTFQAANQAGQVTTVGLATTYTGLCVSNPVGNTKNLVLTKVTAAFPVAPAAALAVGVMTGYNGATNVTHTTPITPKSQFVGVGGAATALADSSATLPTAPLVNTILGIVGTAAVTAVNAVQGFSVDLEGSIVLPPGGYAAIYTSAASGAAGMFASIQWEEVPV